MIIAIDGPAGAGKSSVARAVAERLGFRYLDTGGLYRAVALAVIENGLDGRDEAKIRGLLRKLSITSDESRVTIDGRDVADRIRDDDVTALVPSISALPGVRTALTEVQRAAARSGDVVMEGRDVGTVVVPDAELKVYLTADLDERARRRARQIGCPDPGRLPEIRESIESRDATDSTRGHSPLKRAQDAVLVDSTDMSEEEVIEHITNLARARAG